jgi:hypothetical protein
MNISSITQQPTYTDKSSNKTQNATTEFQDELNKQQGGRWKNHFIEGLSSSQNQALNNKLDEMGITSDEEIYQIKTKIEGKMLTFKSLGWSPSNYTESHIRSLEFGQKNGGA